MYRISVALTFVYAIYDVLSNIGFRLDGFVQIIGFVPFFDLGLGWIVPAIVGAIVGYVMDRFVTDYKETEVLDKKVS